MTAASNGNLESVALLLPSSNATLLDPRGLSAFMLANQWGHLDCAILIEDFLRSEEESATFHQKTLHPHPILPKKNHL